jgi:hypothetical protein
MFLFLGSLGLLLTGQSAYSDCVTDTANPGCVHFFMRTTSAFAPYTTDNTVAQKQWFQTHFWEMLEFPPTFNSELSWFPNASAYLDLWGIGTGDPVAQAHPEWILKDQDGNWLYINYNCAGGACSHWAGDFANPDFRAYQINLLTQYVNAGYPSIFLDNVDLTVQT